MCFINVYVCVSGKWLIKITLPSMSSYAEKMKKTSQIILENKQGVEIVFLRDTKVRGEHFSPQLRNVRWNQYVYTGSAILQHLLNN